MNVAQIDLRENFNCNPKFLFDSWLDSKKHGEMIGSDAKIYPKVDSAFSMWDNTIQGRNIKIDKKNLKIVQAWRSEYDDWPLNTPSKLTIEFLASGNGKAELHLTQSGIPESHVADIEEGWKEYYLGPIKKYLEK